MRDLCDYPGCGNVRALKDVGPNGVRHYRAFCQKHHHGGHTVRETHGNVCSRCSWKGKVQRHRIDPKGSYRSVNLEILCPNCHNAAHGRGEWNCEQVSGM